MLSKIFLSSDHGGFELKEKVKNFLIDNNFEYEDLGCSSLEPVDYPDYAKKLAKRVKSKKTIHYKTGTKKMVANILWEFFL